MDIVKLRELLEQELSGDELVSLDPEFYEEIRGLLEAISLSAERSRERGESLDERLFLEELKIAKKLIAEILRIRLHKLVDLAFSGSLPELVEDEKRVFMFLRSFFELSPREINDVEISTKRSLSKKTLEELPSKLVSFNLGLYIVYTNLPTILGPDMKEYGPIKEGDLVTLPPEIGEVLIKRDLARKVKLDL